MRFDDLLLHPRNNTSKLLIWRELKKDLQGDYFMTIQNLISGEIMSDDNNDSTDNSNNNQNFEEPLINGKLIFQLLY